MRPCMVTYIENFVNCWKIWICVEILKWSDVIKRISEKEEKEIIRLYLEENLSSVEIGKILNRGYRTVQRALNKNGVQLRSLSDSQFVKLDKTPNIRLYDKD